MKPLARLTIGAMTMAAALFSFGRPALAQFPRVTIDCSVQNLTPAAGSTVPFDCMVRDTFGVGVPAAPLTFFVAVDASGQASFSGLKAVIASTDNQGHVIQVLQVGSKAGIVGVDVTFTGVKGWYTTLKVAGGGTTTTTTTASPTTASPTAPLSPPAAGALTTQAVAALAGAAPTGSTTAGAALRAPVAAAPLQSPATSFRPPNTGSGGLLTRDCDSSC